MSAFCLPYGIQNSFYAFLSQAKRLYVSWLFVTGKLALCMVVAVWLLFVADKATPMYGGVEWWLFVVGRQSDSSMILSVWWLFVTGKAALYVW